MSGPKEMRRRRSAGSASPLQSLLRPQRGLTDEQLAALAPITNAATAHYATRREAGAGTDFDGLVDPSGSLADFEAMDGGAVQTTSTPVAQDFDAVHGLSPLNESLARPAMPASRTVARPHRGLPDTLSPWLGSPSDAVLAGWREIVAGFDAVENHVPIDELVPNRKPRNVKDRLILYYHDGKKKTRERLRARFEIPPSPGLAIGDSPPPTPTMSRWASARKSFLQEVLKAGATVPKSLAIANANVVRWTVEQFKAIDAGKSPRHAIRTSAVVRDYYVAKKRNDQATMNWLRQQFTTGDPREYYLYRFGHATEEASREIYAADPAFKGEIVADLVPRFLGNFAFSIAVAGAGRFLRLPVVVLPTIQGTAVNASRQFEDALKHGASIEEATRAAELGGVVGVAQAIPIARLLDRLNKATGGTIRRYLAEGAIGGFEKAVQVSFERVANNLAASDLVAYHKKRGLFEGAGAGEVISINAALIFNFIAAALGSRQRAKSPTPSGASDGASSGD